MKPTAEQIKTATAEFSDELNVLLLNIRESAMRQFEYGITSNVPAGRETIAEVAKISIERGFVSGVSQFHHFDITATILTAGNLAENVNAHSEAEKIFALASVEA